MFFLNVNRMNQLEFDAFQFRTVFDVLKDLLTHCYLIFNGDTITIKNIDPEKIIHVKCWLLATKVEIVHSGCFEFSTYAQTIYKMFRAASPGHKVKIMIDKENNQLIFSVSKNGFAIVSRLTSLAIEPSALNIQVEQPILLDSQQMSTTHLHKIMYTLSAISRVASIHWKNCGIVFTAKDNIQTTVSIEAPFSENELTEHPFEKTVNIIIKYLEKFCNKNVDKVLTLGLGVDGQIIAAYDLLNGGLSLTMASLE